MIVPTGKALRATRTFGPSGTAGAAAACCAPAPANMFLAMTAVTTAMTKAPTSRASFFTFMARSPPLEGSPNQSQTSGKLVKKALGENREAAEGDRDSVWNFGPALASLGAMPGQQAECENPSADRHQHQELHCDSRWKPQCQGSGELDVASAHHAGIKSARENREDDCAGAELDCDSRPRRERDRQPIHRGERRNGKVEPIRNRESSHVDDRRHNEQRGKAGEQDFGKGRIEHGQSH